MKTRRRIFRRRWARIIGTCPLITHNVHASRLSNPPSANWTARNFCDDFSINWCSRFYKLKFWLKREELKHFWSKILSSSWSPCILNSIQIILRQDWSWIIARIDQNRPLNAEHTSKKKPEKYSSIESTWSPIFTSIGLVVWFLRNPCNLCSLDYI